MSYAPFEIERLSNVPLSPGSRQRSRLSRNNSSTLSVSDDMPYEKPTSNTPNSSSTHQTCRRRRSFSAMSAGRIRTLLLMIAFLVLAALLTHLMMSSKMVWLLEGDEKTEGKILHATTNNTSVETSFVPTPAPSQNLTTPQPTSPPKSSSSSSSSSWQDTGDSTGDNFVLPPPPLLENASLIFASRWCDVKLDSWFPSKETNAWQQRAPYVLIPGAKQAGGEALAHLLAQHPQIVLSKPPSLGQFYPQRFHLVNRDDQTHVLMARAKMYARDYASIKSNEQLLGVDYTSGYLFYPPTRILCVMPWVRLLIVLRDPVDRLWSHYQTASKIHGFKGSFEEWIARDWQVLENAGLTSIKPSNTTALDIAWHKYHSKTAEGSIGRSLYEPQMRQWFQTMRAVGRDMTKDVLIIYVEHLIADPERILNRVTDFLGLKKKTSTFDTQAIVQQLKGESSSVGITDDKKKELEQLFKPFNVRLKKLLKSYNVPTTLTK